MCINYIIKVIMPYLFRYVRCNIVLSSLLIETYMNGAQKNNIVYHIGYMTLCIFANVYVNLAY